MAEFERASDAVSAALAFQFDHTDYLDSLADGFKPAVRIGITLGEVVIADNTITSAVNSVISVIPTSLISAFISPSVYMMD